MSMRLAVRGTPKGALRTHSAQQAPLWGGLVVIRVMSARAPVLGLCFFVHMNKNIDIYHRKKSPIATRRPNVASGKCISRHRTQWAIRKAVVAMPFGAPVDPLVQSMNAVSRNAAAPGLPDIYVYIDQHGYR